MVEQIYSESARKIQQNKNEIERAFNVQIEVKGKVVFIEGKAEAEFLCLSAVKAMNMGFQLGDVLDLKHDDFSFEIINIKNIAKRKDLSQVRARVIGTERKVLRTIEYLTDCSIVLHDNIIGIIGPLTGVKKAVYVLKRIVAGSKHANMYAWLELQKAKEKESF